MPPPPTLTEEEEKERQRRIGLVDKIGPLPVEPVEPAEGGTVQYQAPAEPEIGPQLEEEERQRRINLVGQGGEAPVKRERKTVKELEALRDAEKKAKEQRAEDVATAAAKAGGVYALKIHRPFHVQRP